MPVICTDGVLPDDDLAAWHAAPLDVRVQLTCAQVRAVFCGPCLARGIALLDLTAGQLLKLFPVPTRRKGAKKLQCWAARCSDGRVRAVLASASWHELRAAAQHRDPVEQIHAAYAESLKPHRPRKSRPSTAR